MTSERKGEKIKSRFQVGLTYLSVFLVAVLLAFNYQLFIVENDFAPAGLNGIATMVQYKTGFSLGYMSLIINVPLAGFLKIKLKDAGLRVVYQLVRTESEMYIIVIGARSDEAVYDTARRRIETNKL